MAVKYYCKSPKRTLFPSLFLSSRDLKAPKMFKI
uniref:Uncharacterized protein n=1 Tax=Rhizophora mucronata TaxID=61149 RepID=A0A2P2JEF7_RHIMU